MPSKHSPPTKENNDLGPADNDAWVYMDYSELSAQKKKNNEQTNKNCPSKLLPIVGHSFKHNAVTEAMLLKNATHVILFGKFSTCKNLK